MAKKSEKVRFEDVVNWDMKVHCSVALTIEPYGYRQGQRIAMLTLDEKLPELTFKQIVLEIYKLKTNCVTILGSDLKIFDLIDYLRKFINYCKIHINTIGLGLTNALRIKKVLVTYDSYLEGMNEDDNIVLFANTKEEIENAQIEADKIRTENKFVGRIFIVSNSDLDNDAYQQLLDRSVHYKTRYQKMY